MRMNKPDHDTFRDWLYLEADGELPPERRPRLAEHVASCPECQAEGRELARMAEVFARERLPVRDDFRTGVLAALPATGWEARHPRAWRLPVAVFVLLAALAFALPWMAASGRPADASLVGVGAAVLGLVRAAAAAGLGLLGASWKSMGLVVAELFASRLVLGVFAVLVVSLDLLLLALLRARRAAAPDVARRQEARGGSSGSPPGPSSGSR